MLQTTQNTGQDVISSLIHAIYNQDKYQLSNNLQFRDWGFMDRELDIPDEQIQALSGPGVASLTVEGQQYGANQRYRGYPKGYTLYKWTSELKVTEDEVHWMMKTNPKRRVAQVTSLISGNINALNYRIDEMVAKMYYLGFGTSFFTGGDAVALFSASHPIRATGSTQSNIITSGGVVNPRFSGAALKDAIAQMCRFVDAANVQMARPRRLRILHSVELEAEVDQMLYSTYGPNNGNTGLQYGSKEAFARRSFNIDHKAIDYIPSTTYSQYWFVVDLDRAEEMASLGVGWMPRLKEDNDIRNGSIFNDGSTLAGPSCLGYQWVVGSTATESA